MVQQRRVKLCPVLLFRTYLCCGEGSESPSDPQP